MTIILTVVGLIVFVISLFTAGLKKAFKRLITFILAGIAIDILMFVFAVLAVAAFHH